MARNAPGVGDFPYRCPMIDGAQVRADGVETESVPTRSTSPLLPPALASVLVLGFVAISVALPESQPAATTSAEGALAQPADLRDSERGIGEVVSGFEDALVGIAEGPEGSFAHVLWPNTRPLVTRETTGAPGASFDKSGVFLAAASGSSEGSGLSLSAGRFNSIRPVSDGVRSFVWHDGSPARLGYVVDDDEGWEVWQAVPGFEPTLAISGPLPTPHLVAMGDWGFAMQDGGELRLLTEDGVHKATYDGQALVSRSDGWLLVSGKSLDLLSAGGGVVRLQPDPDRVGSLRSASFSPDGDSVALLGDDGIVIIPLSGGGETKQFDIGDASSGAWSADSRFFIVSRSSGVSIFDLRSVNQFRLLEDHELVTVAVIPLSGS